ncbi:transcription factor [Schizosaccharomyces japonicus yFS275]|uniref:Transcription factor n=1 Tax=Schizosaccharomyces japonicus (strain yFS275 / FY16936) TaxID=402676 RepID=B6K1N8_SCHJY|nr:transcription factor [Schizosaccharomyces japonicus yFS275]EEB07069.2 transcription factor [Schizosaccharomyces japonicus yFS275]
MMEAVPKEFVPKKRRVLAQSPQACLRCRRKKIKCSGGKPTCTTCANNNVQCVWPSRPNMRGKRSINQLNSSEVLGKNGDSVSLHGQTYHHALPLSQSSISDISDGMEFPLTGSLSGDDYNKRFRMPSHKKILRFWEIFQKTSYIEVFGLFHKAQITAQIAHQSIPPTLALCICAHAARFSQEEIAHFKTPALASDYYAKQAFSMLSFQLQDISLVNIASLLLLALLELGAGRGSKSWLLLGMAIRMVDSMDLGDEPDNDPLGRQSTSLSWGDREMRRRTYWACFIVERLLTTGYLAPSKLRTLSLKLEKTNIQLPCNEEDFLYFREMLTETFDGSAPKAAYTEYSAENSIPQKSPTNSIMAWLVRLTSVWSDTSRWVLSGGCLQNIVPPWLPQSEFHQHMDQLLEWRKALPSQLCWSYVNYTANSIPGSSIGSPYVFLHLLYHTATVYLIRNLLDLFPKKCNNKFSLFSSLSVRFGQHPPTMWVDEILNTLLSSADMITKLAKDPINHNMSPFFGFSILNASTIHMLCKFCLFNSDPGFATSSTYVETDYQVLYERAKYWKTNQDMLTVFQKLYNYYRFQYAEPEQPFFDLKFLGFPQCILEYASTMEDQQSVNPAVDVAATYTKELLSKPVTDFPKFGDNSVRKFTETGKEPAPTLSPSHMQDVLNQELPIPLKTSLPLGDIQWWNEVFGNEVKSDFGLRPYDDLQDHGLAI